jgi:hypothetical protein
MAAKKYLISWHNRKEKPKKKRSFRFVLKDVPVKYQTTLRGISTWAKAHLSTKYKVPLESVCIDEVYGGIRK